jgi:hypothetical protein
MATSKRRPPAQARAASPSQRQALSPGSARLDAGTSAPRSTSRPIVH